MDNQTFLDVTSYITENIYHSGVWDETTDEKRRKAVSNSIETLLTYLPKYFEDEAAIPVNVLAQQTIWLMRVDDTFLRAEMGVTYIQMAGVMLNISNKDRSIAPYVLDYLGITPDPITGGLSKRKVGRYINREIGTPDSIYRREQ